MHNISKELFLETMEAIRAQREHDDKCHEAFKVLLPNDFVTSYDNDVIMSQLTKLLKVAFNDNHKDSWIDYFIYELNFGKTYEKGCATDRDGSNINLSNPKHLYKFLVKEMKHK